MYSSSVNPSGFNPIGLVRTHAAPRSNKQQGQNLKAALAASVHNVGNTRSSPTSSMPANDADLGKKPDRSRLCRGLGGCLEDLLALADIEKDFSFDAHDFFTLRHCAAGREDFESQLYALIDKKHPDPEDKKLAAAAHYLACKERDRDVHPLRPDDADEQRTIQDQLSQYQKKAVSHIDWLCGSTFTKYEQDDVPRFRLSPFVRTLQTISPGALVAVELRFPGSTLPPSTHTFLKDSFASMDMVHGKSRGFFRKILEMDRLCAACPNHRRSGFMPSEILLRQAVLAKNLPATYKILEGACLARLDNKLDAYHLHSHQDGSVLNDKTFWKGASPLWLKLLLTPGILQIDQKSAFDRQSPLARACQYAPDSRTLLPLLEAGANPYPEDHSPIEALLSSEDPKARMDKLDAFLDYPGLNPNWGHRPSSSPLCIAARRGMVPELKRILQQPGTNPNLPDKEPHRSPLQWACTAFFTRDSTNGATDDQYADVIVALVEAGAELSIDAVRQPTDWYREPIQQYDRDIGLFLKLLADRRSLPTRDVLDTPAGQAKLAKIKEAIETGLKLYDQKKEQEQKKQKEQQKKSQPEV